MLRRRRAAIINKQSVPYGMEKVEYLESSGTQCILSDLICKGYIKAATKFMSLSDGNGFIFGYQTTPNLNQCGILINSQTYDGLSLFHTLDAHFFTNIETNKIYNVDFSSQECVLNGIDLSKTIGDLLIVEYPGVIALFARTEDNIPRHFLTGRIYYIKITNQEGESIEMSPTLDRTGTPCMFDKVTRKNFYNAGPGQFKYIRPNGLPSDYTQVEYLESQGQQYIIPWDGALGELDVEATFFYRERKNWAHVFARQNGWSDWSWNRFAPTVVAYLEVYNTGKIYRNSESSLYEFETDRIYHVKNSKNAFYVDGEKVY